MKNKDSIFELRTKRHFYAIACIIASLLLLIFNDPGYAGATERVREDLLCNQQLNEACTIRGNSHSRIRYLNHWVCGLHQ